MYLGTGAWHTRNSQLFQLDQIGKMIESAKQDISLILNRKHKGFKDRAPLWSVVQETIPLPLCDKTQPDRVLRFVKLTVAGSSSFYCSILLND